MSASNEYRTIKSMIKRVAVQAACGKLLPYLAKWKDTIVRTDRERLKKGFAATGVMNLDSGSEGRSNLKLIDDIISQHNSLC